MATVDRIMARWCYRAWWKGSRDAALIRRVERYEKALKQIVVVDREETDPHLAIDQCGNIACEALKEEPDSAGSAAIVCGDETPSKESIQAIEQVLKAAKNRFGG